MWGRFSRARRQVAAERDRQERDLRHLVFLRDKIFAHPDIARMYWHTLHPDDLESLSSNRFGEISEGIRPTESLSDASESPVAELVRDFLSGLTEAEKMHLIRQLGVAFRGFRRDDLADRLEAAQQKTGQEAAS